jgi:hypothetical protein
MPATTTFPNGQTLVSSALTIDQINAIMQPLLTGSLGILPTDPLANSFVRIGWQITGIPAWNIDQDILSFRCVEEDNDYDKIRNANRTNLGLDLIKANYEYTRVWRVTLVFRGPNSFDNARLVRAALLLDWTHDTLAQSNLYVVPAIQSPLRIPELHNGQWWEVINLSFLINEQVNETIAINAVNSTEVILNKASGVVADITVTE